MTYIYSNEEVQGISGAYIAPHLFDGAYKNAKKVYTNDGKIAKAYTDIGVEVLPIEEPLSKEDKKFNALIVKLDVLKEKEVKFCAEHLGLEFTTVEETVLKIKEFLELK